MRNLFYVLSILVTVFDQCYCFCFLTTVKKNVIFSQLKSSKFDMSAEALAQMKNLKKEDIDKMLEEFDNMNPIQRNALKAMNMDPEMMKTTMKMMKDNPTMLTQAQTMMETMSAEELLDKSREAQEQLKKMSPDELNSVNEAIKNSNSVDGTGLDDKETQPDTGLGSSADSNVVDAMFSVAEFMSYPPTEGGVTFTGFYSLPVIQLLSGDREFDLSLSELSECWLDIIGSLTARCDRDKFELVWREVQEYFEEDIMAEARKEARKKTSPSKKIRSASSSTIGDNLNKKELEDVNNRVKNLSNGEVDSVLGMMENMDSVQESRLKSMGVDPTLMQETAKMLKDNPLLRDQAKKMMENMSPAVCNCKQQFLSFLYFTF